MNREITGLNLKDPQQPVFVLSALILKDENWFLLENEYNIILQKYLTFPLPDVFELHAMELKNGSGIFETLKLENRLALRNDIFDLLCRYKISFIHRRIIKKAFEKFCLENYGPGIHVDPYIMALPFICIEIDSFLKNKEVNALGMLIFDEQKEYYAHVERSIKILRLDKGSLLKTSNIIEKGFFVDSKKKLCAPDFRSGCLLHQKIRRVKTGNKSQRTG